MSRPRRSSRSANRGWRRGATQHRRRRGHGPALRAYCSGRRRGSASRGGGPGRRARRVRAQRAEGRPDRRPRWCRDALVVFSHLCYASGNSEPGLAEGTLDQAEQRVDNYAAGFFKAGARAVIADAFLSPTYYVTSVLRGHSTVEGIWRAAPNRNDHFLTFASVRTKGAIAAMDPDEADSGFHRSIVARPRLTSAEVLGGAPRRPVEVEPVLEPSLAGLGVTFGEPDLSR